MQSSANPVAVRGPRKFPKLMIRGDNIVLFQFHSTGTGDLADGVLVHGDHPHLNVGQVSKFRFSEFKDFEGEVTLSNDGQ